MDISTMIDVFIFRFDYKWRNWVCENNRSVGLNRITRSWLRKWKIFINQQKRLKKNKDYWKKRKCCWRKHRKSMRMWLFQWKKKNKRNKWSWRDNNNNNNNKKRNNDMHCIYTFKIPLNENCLEVVMSPHQTLPHVLSLCFPLSLMLWLSVLRSTQLPFCKYSISMICPFSLLWSKLSTKLFQTRTSLYFFSFSLSHFVLFCCLWLMNVWLFVLLCFVVCCECSGECVGWFDIVCDDGVESFGFHWSSDQSDDWMGLDYKRCWSKSSSSWGRITISHSQSLHAFLWIRILSQFTTLPLVHQIGTLNNNLELDPLLIKWDQDVLDHIRLIKSYAQQILIEIYDHLTKLPLYVFLCLFLSLCLFVSSFDLLFCLIFLQNLSLCFSFHRAFRCVCVDCWRDWSWRVHIHNNSTQCNSFDFSLQSVLHTDDSDSRVLRTLHFFSSNLKWQSTCSHSRCLKVPHWLVITDFSFMSLHRNTWKIFLYLVSIAYVFLCSCIIVCFMFWCWNFFNV